MNIKIKGSREHNLKNVDVEFQNGLTSVTGVSGSGKTSLVFDTLYHEARRIFFETFTPFSNKLRVNPAKVESISGLAPAIALPQDQLNRNPNSTLASATGIHVLLRLYYSRFGIRICANCGTKLSLKLTEDEILNKILKRSSEGTLEVYAILLRNVMGSHKTLLELLKKQFSEENIIIDGNVWNGEILDYQKGHDIKIRISKFNESPKIEEIRKSITTITALGALGVTISNHKADFFISLTNYCLKCGNDIFKIEPKFFYQECPYCKRKGCEKCKNTGLHPIVNTIYAFQKTLPELLNLSVLDLLERIERNYPETKTNRLVSEIRKRLIALNRVGLGYLALNRISPSLSRGESQRVRIALTLVNKLEDIIYILDEPTIGQHFVDVQKFLPVLSELPGPVIYIEHDRNSTAYADHVIDIGPGAGKEGGEIIFTGTPQELWTSNTPTGQYFSLKKTVNIPKKRVSPQLFLRIEKAFEHNLKNIDVNIPLKRFTVITGVSGSGKSTLIKDVLYKSLKNKKPIGCKRISPLSIKSKLVDQSPIGKNPRSNPATYTKISDIIRKFYADLSNFSPSHFSFNRSEGACPSCNGMGSIEVKMKYLPSTWITCSECEGERFKDQILSTKIEFKGEELSIADLYNLSISEVYELFKIETRLPSTSLQRLLKMLKTLNDIGLGYLSLGQPSPTLSGGEAQRVKLVKYLGRNNLENHILLLDEPSTGLHPQDLNGLLMILNRLVKSGATVIVVEHDLDIIKSADWVIDLGPFSGPNGGKMLYSGPLEGLFQVKNSSTAKALKANKDLNFKDQTKNKVSMSKSIQVKNARIHNLKGIDIDFPKGKLTVVTGVSGSGKSSLVIDTLHKEAERRFLETLSMYERQSIHESMESQVDSIRGLGITTLITPESHLHERSFNLRSTLGRVTEIIIHLARLFAFFGDKMCPNCGEKMKRNEKWRCQKCNIQIPLAKPKHFISSNYSAACIACNGVGTIHEAAPEKLIIHPEKPLCNGAMFSPGFFPQGYLCKPYNGGYYIIQSLASRYNFDPSTTPWNEMSNEAKDAFLYGDKKPLKVNFENRSGKITTKELEFLGFYEQWVRDWDFGGTFTRKKVCKKCKGSKLREEYLSVLLQDYNIHELSEMPLDELLNVLKKVPINKTASSLVKSSYNTIIKKIKFLIDMSLGYLNLYRITASLSAGEAQRVRLAGLIGSELSSLTVLLDEPSRGLHPSELEILSKKLLELRDNENTIIMIEHDPQLIQKADNVVDIGPEAGTNGGEIVGTGTPHEIKNKNTLTGKWLSGNKRFTINKTYRKPKKWLKIYGARENNLKGDLVKIPLECLVGVCGISGSGKSSLIIDTLGRTLSPKQYTTSVSYEPISPGIHEKIENKPSNTIIIDQTKSNVKSPIKFLGLKNKFEKLYAETDYARENGITLKMLKQSCSACKGSGFITTDMGFLPDLKSECEICNGTGYQAEAFKVKINGVSLPEVNNLTIKQAYNIFNFEEKIKQKLNILIEVGLGYLNLNQPLHTISSGEAQRLKIAKELSKKSLKKTLFILDEPTIGLHMEDISRLMNLLQKLVNKKHTVIIIEHHPHILASCDWLIELGPGSGPKGGNIIAAGSPIEIVKIKTPTSPYLKIILEGTK